MHDNNINVTQCRKCGAVITFIRTATASSVAVDADPITIFERMGGETVGYTLSGRRIQGDEVKPGSLKAWQVRRKHSCSRSEGADAERLRQMTGT